MWRVTIEKLNGHKPVQKTSYQAEEIHYEDLPNILSLVMKQLGIDAEPEEVFSFNIKEQLAAAEEAAFLQEGGAVYEDLDVQNATPGVYRIEYPNGNSHITVLMEELGDRYLVFYDLNEKLDVRDVNHISDDITFDLQYLRPL